MIKKFEQFSFDEFNEDENESIKIPDIYEMYFHKGEFDVFDGRTYEMKPMEKRNGFKCPGVFYPDTTEIYLGLREAGDFFAYDRKYVWVWFSNSKIKTRKFVRHDYGFYITITTLDDGGLYADWFEPLTRNKLDKVVEYFNKNMILKDADDIVFDIENIIGKKCDGYLTS